MTFVTILNIILAIAFTGFAWLNLNDKDAPLWVSIYMLAAIGCGLAAFGVFVPVAYIVLGGCYLVYAITLFFAKDGVRDWLVKYNRPNIAQSMQATKPYIENTREFFGLLICCAAFAFNYVIASK